jgi:hypothetical protein
MKLRFGVARTHGCTNGDIEALADAMRALKNHPIVKKQARNSDHLIIT